MEVVNKFLLTSICMWVAPISIIYAFNHHLLSGSTGLTSESTTMWSAILAVISVNVVIAFYIYAAIKEPSAKHEPDTRFLSDARASVKQLGLDKIDSSSDSAKQE